MAGTVRPAHLSSGFSCDNVRRKREPTACAGCGGLSRGATLRYSRGGAQAVPRRTVRTSSRSTANGEVPLRRLAVAILAVPVIASIYIATLLAVPGARRYLAAVGTLLLVGVVGAGFILP